MEYDHVVLGIASALALLHGLAVRQLQGPVLVGAMVVQLALQFALLLYFTHRVGHEAPVLLNWGLLYVLLLVHACTESVAPVHRELDIVYVARLLRLPASFVRRVIDEKGYFPLDDYHRLCTSDQGTAIYRVYYKRYFDAPVDRL